MAELIHIRRLGVNDAAEYRRVRLLALREYPTAFASSFEEESNRTLEEFAERLNPNAENCVYAATEVIGGVETVVCTVGVIRSERIKLRHTVDIVGVWTAPSHQGKGLARQVLAQALVYARTLPQARRAVLGVNTKNVAAIKVYESVGFKTFATDPCFLVVNGEDQAEYQMQLWL